MNDSGGPIKGRVLVLDGETRTALAVVRSLGREGLEVGCASAKSGAIACKSRHTHRQFSLPDAATDQTAYVDAVAELIQVWRPEMLLPLTDRSVTLILGEAKRFRSRTCLPFVGDEVFHSVADKGNLATIAGGLGIKVPETLTIPSLANRPDNIVDEIERFPYPAVLKPEVSDRVHDGRFVKTPVRYVASSEEVGRWLGRETPAQIPHLLQQRIFGDGVGVFALASGGKIVAPFAHRRLLEKPPSGGVSVLCESIALDSAPVAEAYRLLEHFSWEGVAMVEFKQTAAGDSYLMEINPRFWGSLQLAIDSGVDFPALLYRRFASRSGGGEVATSGDYKVGQRMRWLLGSVDHAIIRMKDEGISAGTDLIRRNSLHVLERFRDTKLQVFRSDDPRPFIHECMQWVGAVLGRS